MSQVYTDNKQQHRVIYGESLWRLARRYYQAPLLWPHILQANSATIVNPDHLQAGNTIIIPGLQGSADELTQSDRRHIAKGYYLAYLYYKKAGRKEAFFALLEASRYDNRLVENDRNRPQLNGTNMLTQPLRQP